MHGLRAETSQQSAIDSRSHFTKKCRPQNQRTTCNRRCGLSPQFFDSLQRDWASKAISFVPADNPFDNSYILKIWSNAVKNQLIYEGAAQTIGHYEGFPLNLRVGNAAHNPYKRLLSFQAYRAFVKWQSFYKLPVAEFPLDCDISEYVGNYKETRANYVENLARAIAAEEDDDAYG